MQKKNRGGGGGGGGGGSGGQPQKPAEPTEEGEEQTVAADNDSASGEATAEDNKDKGKGQDNKEKGKGQDGKDKGKKTPPPPPLVTAVLKVDMHCDGCAKRIRASVHRYAGKPLPFLHFSLSMNQLEPGDADDDDRCLLIAQAWRAWRWRSTRAP